MSEKKLKIIAVVLMVAAFICLAIGTAFAVDFMAEYPEAFGCDLKRPVVVASKPFVVSPVVGPLNEVVSLEPTPLGPYQFEYLENYSNLLAGDYEVAWDDGDIIDVVVFRDPLDEGAVRFSFLSFVGIDTIDIPFSSFALYNTTFENLAIDFESQVMSFSFIGGEEFSVSYASDSRVAVVVRFYDSFTAFDGDDQVIDPGPDYAFFVRLFLDTNAVISPIIDTLVSGLRALGTNVGRAFSTMANAIFIDADGTGLSTFGILVVVFAAVSLGLSLTRWVLNFCSSWGKRNR